MTLLEEVVARSQRLAKTTRYQYQMVVRAFIAFAGNEPLNWTPARVEAWIASLTVGPSSVNNYVAALKYASRRFSAIFDARDFAAAAEPVLVPAEKHPRSPRPLSPDEVARILATCNGGEPRKLRDRAILILGLCAGFRRAELARIDLRDLDSADRSIVVIAKRNKRHRVRLDVGCWQQIEGWISWLGLRRIRTGRLFRSLRRCLDAELGYLVGASLTPEGVYGAIRRRARQAGVENVSPHSLRHTLVAMLREQGVPEEQIRGRLGHRSVETTAGYGREAVFEAPAFHW